MQVMQVRGICGGFLFVPGVRRERKEETEDNDSGG